MATTPMHNLATIIKRLEAATSRLEDIASATVEPNKANADAAAPASTAPLPPAPTSLPSPETAGALAPLLPQSVEEFDAFITGALRQYVNLSDEVGGPVSEQASNVLRAFIGQRKIILVSTQAKKPDMADPAYTELLKPLQDAIAAVTDIREANRGSPFFNHLSAVSESISVVAWVTIDTKPFKHVEESLGSAQYWGNRVLKEYKDKDGKHVEWVQRYYGVFKKLEAFVKDTFPNGIPWTVRGVSIKEAIRQIEQTEPAAPHTQAAAVGGPPPPPPPPPGPPPPPLKFDDAPKAAPAKETSAIDAVFSDLNKGEAVTKGLRKVNPDEMTHKNPSLRAGATVPTRSDSQSSISRGKSLAPSKKPKPEAMRTKKPPVKRLEGNKWIIENYDGESEPVEIEAEISHSILISRCNKTTIMIKNKANAISIDNSPRLSLVIESLVSSVDVIKSSNFALQVLGTLPTLLLDSVDGAQVYLGKQSTNTEVFSSKCSGINLNLLESEEGDYKEVPLPEQLRSYINKDGKVVSEIVEHAG